MQIIMFKKSSQFDAPFAEIKVENENKVEEKKLILCKNCGHIISSPQQIIEINNKKSHVFDNPTGVTYTIICFSSADGCAITGESTDEYTWFPGYSWCFAVCSNCLSHLGWFYQSGDSSFFGLIKAHIVENL